MNVPINDKKIGIVNYNTGNVGSLYKTLKKINKNVKIIEKPNDFDLCHKIFLPGVGSYQTAIKSLKLTKIDKKKKNFFLILVIVFLQYV